MKNYNKFIDSLNILDGVIIYNSFDIDENIPFQEQWYSYNEDILQVKFGDRFILDVGWYPEGDPEGHFVVKAILDSDWINPLSKIKSRTLFELKIAIENTAIFINKMEKIKDIPFRTIQYAGWSDINDKFIKSLNVLKGDIVYNYSSKNGLPGVLDALPGIVLQIKFGQRFIIDVDRRINDEIYGSGVFIVRLIIDKDWNNFLSKIKCYTIQELSTAIQRTAIFIDNLSKIDNIPYREIEHIVEDNEPLNYNEFIQELNILNGKIHYHNFINEKLPLVDQLDLLQDGLLQIGFGERYSISVSWIPKNNPEGCFKIQIIKDNDYEDPFFIETCRALGSLKKKIEKAAQIINKIMKIKNFPSRDVQL